MSKRTDDTWLFVAEWFDPLPQLKRKYLLKYFVDTHMAEMVDLKSKKTFLKKSPCPPELSATEFFIGAKILLYSRELEIIDFGDKKTMETLQYQTQQCTLIVPSELYQYWGKVVDTFSEQSMIVKVKSILISSNVADKMCDILGISNSRKLSQAMATGVNLVVIAQTEDGYSKLSSLADKLSAKFGGEIFSSKNGSESNDLQELLLKQYKSITATFDSSTCCIIKPHAVKNKLIGKILDYIIMQGYEVSAVSSLHFDRSQAEEFLEVYNGVVPEYSDHVLQLSNGMCVALELRAEDPVKTFRMTAGPWDVGMAKELYPDSIRGLFGSDLIRNAVHCTDLPRDATSECEYCFKIMQ